MHANTTNNIITKLTPCGDDNVSSFVPLECCTIEVQGMKLTCRGGMYIIHLSVLSYASCLSALSLRLTVSSLPVQDQQVVIHSQGRGVIRANAKASHASSQCR